MPAIFIHDRVNHDVVADQALLDDPRPQWSGYHAPLFALAARALLPLAHYHEVLRWLHIQVFALFIADQGFLLAALLAYTLLRRTCHHALHTWQVRGQLLPAGMLALPA